jgi:hypothetical protein
MIISVSDLFFSSFKRNMCVKIPYPVILAVKCTAETGLLYQNSYYILNGSVRFIVDQLAATRIQFFGMLFCVSVRT